MQKFIMHLTILFPAACNLKIWNALNISVRFARVSLPKIGLSAICIASFPWKKLIWNFFFAPFNTSSRVHIIIEVKEICFSSYRLHICLRLICFLIHGVHSSLSFKASILFTLIQTSLMHRLTTLILANKKQEDFKIWMRM